MVNIWDSRSYFFTEMRNFLKLGDFEVFIEGFKEFQIYEFFLFYFRYIY